LAKKEVTVSAFPNRYRELRNFRVPDDSRRIASQICEQAVMR
jgi:hypothetical protein